MVQSYQRDKENIIKCLGIIKSKANQRTRDQIKEQRKDKK